MRKSSLLLAITAMAAMLAVCGVALAGTVAVRNTNDSGPGSLRAAIAAANANPGRDLITFAPSVRGEIQLRGVLPTLRGDLEVRGPGSSRLAVRRAVQRAFRVFTVAGDSTVRITGLTVSNGLARDARGNCQPTDSGGGVRNDGRLTLRNVVSPATRPTATAAGSPTAPR